MEKREGLERNQISVYAAALVIGAGAGLISEPLGRSLEPLISPLLAVLLFGMFTMIPFLRLREALADLKFVAALLIANFAVVPLIVWGLLSLFPQPEAVTIGVCLVLLTPCIDYVIVFTALGRGDEKAMTAATPVLFVLQMALLPLYLRLFAGPEAAGLVQAGPFAEAFLTLILLPLAAALMTQLWAARSGGAGRTAEAAAAAVRRKYEALQEAGGDEAGSYAPEKAGGAADRAEAEGAGSAEAGGGRAVVGSGAADRAERMGAAAAGAPPIGTRVLDAAAWIPVPFMALVLIAFAASQVGRIAADPGPVLRVLPVYALFLLIMPPLARLIGRLLRLEAGSGRALIFSAFTRNSLVVLPLALALPGEAANAAAAVIVAQTMTELIGELVYVRAVPGLIWRDGKKPARKAAG
ncbi:arsenic resistance protein [Saccharibacillus alkalitolerans]|uniref:arsenic resistance protein n=1 Tax=Saccharibacillus alkalitolerans TaxID=2705290 RepID=UPI001F3690DF|nr:bile acid:sodium symporter [Saccharibacillus alkalitolerans]